MENDSATPPNHSKAKQRRDRKGGLKKRGRGREASEATGTLASSTGTQSEVLCEAAVTPGAVHVQPSTQGDPNNSSIINGRKGRAKRVPRKATETDPRTKSPKSSRQKRSKSPIPQDDIEDLPVLAPGALSVQPSAGHPDSEEVSQGQLDSAEKGEPDKMEPNHGEETVIVAHLAVDNVDDQFRKQVVKEAEDKVFKGIAPAEVYEAKEGGNRKYYIIAAVVILIIAGVVIGVVVAGGSDDAPKDPEPSPPPTFAPITVDPALSQDFCEDGVELLAPEIILGSTAEATPDNSFDICDGVTNNGIGVWYVVEGTGDPVSVQTCRDTTFDTQLSVYEGGSCGALKCVTANDQRTSCGQNGSHLTFFAEQGARYYILVHGNRRANGIFSVQLQMEGDNSNCENATRFEDFEAGSLDGVSIFGSNKFASSGDRRGIPFCDTVAGAVGVWYVFQSKATRFIQVRLDDFLGGIHVYSGACGADNLVCVGGSEAGAIMWTATLGTDYLLYVHGDEFNVADFTLTLLPGGILEIDYDASTNVQCESAEDLTFWESQSIQVPGSTEQGQVANVPPCNLVMSTAKGLWYSVLGTGNGMLASTCDTVSDFDTQISVFVGTCSELECVGGGDQNCGDQSSVAWRSEANRVYYVLVHGHEGREGDFSLLVEEFTVRSAGECHDALPVTMNGVGILGTTEGSRVQGTDSCMEGSAEAPSAWYSVIGTGATLLATTKWFGEEVKIEVYTGSCDNLVCAGSLDIGETVLRTVVWESAEDQVYFIQVYGEGEFSLTVQELPENFVCNGVVEDVQIGSTVLGSTFFAQAEQFECSVAGTYTGIWYRFVSSHSGTVVASTCSDITDFETSIHVLEGQNCGFNSCTTNDGQSCGSGSFVAWESVPGQEYRILVQGASPGEFGSFALSVGIENDICDQASPLEIYGNILRSTFGATTESTLPACPGDESIGTGPSVWYSVKGIDGSLQASTCHSETDFDTVLSVYEGPSCQQLSCVAVNDNSCGVRSTVKWESTEGTIYFVHVSGNTAGEFSLSLAEDLNQRPQTAVLLPSDGSEITVPYVVILGFEDPCTNPIPDPPGFQSWFTVTGTGGLVSIDACGNEEFAVSRVSLTEKSADVFSCVETVQSCNITFDSAIRQEYRVGLWIPAPVSVLVSVESNNFDCQAAFGPLSVGDAVPGRIDGATTDDSEECGRATGRGVGVWFNFVGIGRPVTAFTCSQATNFDTQLSVYTGSDCSRLQCLGGEDDNCGTSSWVMFPTSEGGDYFILVSAKGPTSGEAGMSTGDFVLQLR